MAVATSQATGRILKKHGWKVVIMSLMMMMTLMTMMMMFTVVNDDDYDGGVYDGEFDDDNVYKFQAGTSAFDIMNS